MKIRKLILSIVAVAMVFSLCAVPAMADESVLDENVIFICDGAQGDGSSADSPLKPTTGNYDPSAPNPDLDKDAALYQAWEKLMKLGGGTIVICGPYTLDNSNCAPIGASSADFRMTAIEHRPDITIRYTSVWNGVDYRQTNGAELIMAGKSHLTFPTATITENLTVRATDDNPDHFIAAGLNALTLGQGTNFIPYEVGNLDAYPMILGSFRSNAGALKEGDSNIIVDIGDENHIGNIYGMCNGGNGKHKGNTNITIKSGNIGHIFGDSRATGQVPQVGDINMNFEGGIYNGLIAGVNVGFSGGCDKVINIKITGGDFTGCSGILMNSTAADALMPEVMNVDCSEASVEVARQIKKVVTMTANLILPADYTENVAPTDPPAGNTDNTEAPSAQDPTQAPNTTTGDAPKSDSNSVVIIVAALIIAVGMVASVAIFTKKKQ